MNKPKREIMSRLAAPSLYRIGVIFLLILLTPILYNEAVLAWFRAHLLIVDLKPAANACLIAFCFPVLYTFYRKHYFSSVLFFSLQFFLSFYFLLLHNEVGFDNDFNDNGALMTLVHKLHYHGFGADLFTGKFHNSYPFVWYFFCLKLLTLSGAEPHFTLKFSQNLACFLVPVLTYFTWKKVWSGPYAVVLSIASMVYLDFFKVNAWIGLILLIPLVLYLHRIIRAPLSYRWNIGDFLWIGALIVFQYYWVLVGVLLFPLVWVILQWDRGKLTMPGKKAAIVISILLTGAGTLSLPYIAPFAFDLLTNPSEPLVNRCYFDPMSLWHFPMSSPGIIGFVSLLGFVGMVAFSQNVRVMTGLFALFLASFGLFYLLSSSILFRFPSNFTKLEYVQTYLLVLSFGVAAAVRMAFLRPLGKMGLVFIAVILAHTSLNAIEVDHQFRPPFDKIDDLQSLTKKIDARSTSLSSIGRPLFYLPFFSFIPFNLHWSNPCQLYSQRAAFIRDLKKCQSPYAISYALKNNRFEPVTLLIFEFHKLDVVLEKDNFPEPQTNEMVTFTRGQLLPPAFEYSPTKQYEVFLVRDQKDWISALSNEEKRLYETEIEKLKPFLSGK